MLSAECTPPAGLFQMVHVALKCGRLCLPCCCRRQTADSGHKRRFRSSCWSRGSRGPLCEYCTNWRVRWQTTSTGTFGAGQAVIQRSNGLCCPGGLADSGSGRDSWGVTSLTTSFWCLEFVQTNEAMPTAVDSKTMCHWKVACQHFRCRIRLVKQLLHSQVTNRAELAAGFERMGSSSGKERDLPYWNCFIPRSQVNVLYLVRTSSSHPGITPCRIKTQLWVTGITRNSLYSKGGGGRDFLRGCLTGLHTGLKPSTTLSSAVFHAGKSSDGWNLLEHLLWRRSKSLQFVTENNHKLSAKQ